MLRSRAAEEGRWTHQPSSLPSPLPAGFIPIADLISARLVDHVHAHLYHTSPHLALADNPAPGIHTVEKECLLHLICQNLGCLHLSCLRLGCLTYDDACAGATCCQSSCKTSHQPRQCPLFHCRCPYIFLLHRSKLFVPIVSRIAPIYAIGSARTVM